MKMNKIIIQILIHLTILIHGYMLQGAHSIPQYRIEFCHGNPNIYATFRPGAYSGYDVWINKRLAVTTQITVKLDSGSTIDLGRDLRFSAEKDTINNIFTFIVIKDVEQLSFTVKGRHSPNHPPYIISIKIDGVENCNDPDRSYFQGHVYGGIAMRFDKAPDKFCGRRRIYRRYTELIVGGSATKAGDFPWHAAILRLKGSTLKYTCGGTLISKLTVLTAAHCAAISGAPLNPEALKVVLGKYYLNAQDIALQEKNIFKIIIHDDFNHKSLDNDIALLIFTTEAAYNNHVQPACVWFHDIYDHIGTNKLNGTVVGWGFDNTDSLSETLKSAVMPQQQDITCIRFDPIFYSNTLNGKKFCGGYGNGTSACNGDSGGGYMVFVQDDLSKKKYREEEDDLDGAWYVKGIVSVSLARNDASICDPKSYTVFTDVAVYRDWILQNMNK